MKPVFLMAALALPVLLTAPFAAYAQDAAADTMPPAEQAAPADSSQPPAAGEAAPAMPSGDNMPPADTAAAPGEAVTPADEAPGNLLQDKWLQMSAEDAYLNMLRVRKPAVDPQAIDSLFFSTWQYELLKQAKVGFLTRPATVAEMSVDPTSTEGRERGPREVSLGGIVYVKPGNWTIWLNGQRVTPDALPGQIIDLQVEKQYIQLKWFDAYNNLIYPIRLRPHQRFNLDSRIFLPGATPEAAPDPNAL